MIAKKIEFLARKWWKAPGGTEIFYFCLMDAVQAVKSPLIRKNLLIVKHHNKYIFPSQHHPLLRDMYFQSLFCPILKRTQITTQWQWLDTTLSR